MQCSLEPQRADHADVAARDAELSGWFREDTGELFRGAPIDPDDHVVDVGCGDGRNLLFCEAGRAFWRSISTWQAVLDLPKGGKLKLQLNNFMSKTEVIVAWKKPSDYDGF